LKKNTNSPMKKEQQRAKRAKAQRPVQRDAKEVLAELVEKLKGNLELKATSASPAEAGPRGELSPNLDRLTVGVDLGDQWSHFCILGLQGETLSEGQLPTTPAEVAEFFQALTPARVVMEVGTHSPWVQEVIAGEGHEVLVANPRLMEGRSGVSARMIGSMRRSWPGWGGWIHSRCTRSGTAVGRCGRTWWCYEHAMPRWQHGPS
jgi:hypothetical protein